MICGHTDLDVLQKSQMWSTHLQTASDQIYEGQRRSKEYVIILGYNILCVRIKKNKVKKK